MRSSSFDRVDLLFPCENPSTDAEDVTFFEYSSCRSTVSFELRRLALARRRRQNYFFVVCDTTPLLRFHLDVKYLAAGRSRGTSSTTV